MSKLLKTIFLIGVLGTAFFYREPIKRVWFQSFTYYFPCKVPITYDIGVFDTRFGISKADFLKAMSDAEQIWEKPVSKNLFQYKEGGTMKINLIYDTRQETTAKLKDMGIVVQNNKASYDALKEKYDAMSVSYSQAKSSFLSLVSNFESQKKAYEAEVAQMNRRGGANKEEFAKLSSQKASLELQLVAINQEQANLNQTVGNINALAQSLNDLAAALNIDVKKFNTVGSTLGGEFDEGLYKSGPNGQEIDIYQFENRTKLVRVLAHELGHALGLEHVEDTKAIMYRLNNGINEVPTATDIAELKTLCRIK